MDLISIITSLIITIIIVSVFRHFQEKKANSSLKSGNKTKKHDNDITPSIKILYGTQTGTSKQLALKLADIANDKNIKVTSFFSLLLPLFFFIFILIMLLFIFI